MNKTFKVTLCRVENTIYVYDNIHAKSEEDAEQFAWKLYNNGEIDFEDVVHAEEFCHQIERV